MNTIHPLRLPAGPVVYVDSIEAAAALARLIDKRLVWRDEKPKEKRDER